MTTPNQETTPATPAADTTPAASGQAGASGTTPAAISLTREELDRQLAEARRSGERGAKEGDEIKQLRAAAKRLAEIEEAQKTETEKLTDRAAKAEAEAQRLTGLYRKTRIEAEFRTLASDKGLKGQPLLDALALADLRSVEVADDGTTKGIDKALEAVLKDRPYLLGSGQQNGQRVAPNINAGDSGRDPSREEAIAQAKLQLAGSGRYT